MIVLVGFMGAGKSTVGRLLAGRLGLPFVDVDAAIEQRAGATIADIFRERGEPYFRTLERDVTAEVLDGAEAVVALGGGAVEDPVTCAALEWSSVVLLDVGYPEAMRRAGNADGRPMLTASDPKALFDRRRALHRRLADVTAATDGRAPQDIADDIAARLGSPASARVVRVPVPLAERTYEVVVGGGVARELSGYLPDLPHAEAVFVVSHPSLRAAAGPVLASLAGRGLRVAWSAVPEGEDSKSLATAERLYAEMAETGVDRDDVVVGFGGGVVCDLAGFVASTYHRGMAVAHVPTTLLAQVDAAIGGETAVNLPHGRNVVGTLHHPVVVVCDVELLRTLAPEEVTNGMAEVVKYGLVADPALLDLVRRRSGDVDAVDARLMTDLVARSARTKAAIVASDGRDGGRRALLDYGHTFGRALERVFEFRGLRHGEAVALGMMAAAHLAHELGRIGGDDVALHREVLSSVGLPTAIACDLDALESAWRQDRKHRRGVRFVLLRGLGRPEAGVAAPREAVARAVERLAS